jgi:alpha,alpha-trehalase
LVITFPFISAGQLQSPHQIYGKLFEQIQMQQVYPDGKTFVDCVPKEDPKQIMALYNAAAEKSAFNLKQFAADHFYLPKVNSSDYHSDTSADVQEHIHQLWNVLKRNPDDNLRYSSLLPLPNAYIVPGGRFREVYYWDSYFTMLGLQVDGKVDMMENMIKNFAFLIDTYGFIPNGNRTYYLTRSQPPFFSLMVDLLAEEKGDDVYKTYQSALLKEYNFWMKGTDSKPGSAVKMPDGTILNRYWDMGTTAREESWREDVESAAGTTMLKDLFYRNIRSGAASGWDFSSRWLKDGTHLTTIQTTNVIAVDLNCLLLHLEQTLVKSYNAKNDKKTAEIYANKAAKRRNAILKYCWNSQKQFFCDYLIKEKKISEEITLAGMFPLFFDIADKTQADKTATIIRDKFLAPGGVITTLHKTGQQWDAPNGWAPLEYITIKGLSNYKQTALADTIAQRWIRLNIKVYKNTGKLMEKYNVENTDLIGGGGEYALQDGFGWTNGVLLKLMKDYPGRQ